MLGGGGMQRTIRSVLLLFQSPDLAQMEFALLFERSDARVILQVAKLRFQTDQPFVLRFGLLGEEILRAGDAVDAGISVAPYR